MTEDPGLAAIDELMAENIRLGYAEIVGQDKDGNALYALTPAGIEHVEQLMEGDG